MHYSQVVIVRFILSWCPARLLGEWTKKHLLPYSETWTYTGISSFLKNPADSVIFNPHSSIFQNCATIKTLHRQLKYDLPTLKCNVPEFSERTYSLNWARTFVAPFNDKLTILFSKRLEFHIKFFFPIYVLDNYGF